jgi:hypothetical protein
LDTISYGHTAIKSIRKEKEKTKRQEQEKEVPRKRKGRMETVIISETIWSTSPPQ